MRRKDYSDAFVVLKVELLFLFKSLGLGESVSGCRCEFLSLLVLV